MRRQVVAGLAVLLGGCSVFHPTSTRQSDLEPKTTSVYGDWVLATSPDSTAFAGASGVEMMLDPGTFTITASYPAQSVTISGSSQLTENGMLTLTPTAGAGVPGFQVGQPVTLMASAAGNALVFIPPRRGDLTPSSVWHKKAASVAAGTTPAR